MPLLNLKDIVVGFGGKPLLEGVSLSIEKGEKVCLIGANGSGKTTLLKVMAGIIPYDFGERALLSGSKVAFLPQAPDFENFKTIGSYVSSGLPENEKIEKPHLVEDILLRFNLDFEAELRSLSGGEKKRVDLARVLVFSPDILFLDEPTNHLDLQSIELLEKDLKAFKGAMVIVSHDRAFLKNLTNRIGWIQNHSLWCNNQGFSTFEEWSESIINQQEREVERMQTKLKQELHWLARGVTARRKRNQGRLKKLFVLRQETFERKIKSGELKISLDEGFRSGSMVVEAKNISKKFGDLELIKDFSIRITRGERIGIIGANGKGKTTLIKILTGEIAPDSGSVRLGENLKIAFFEQHRIELNPNATLKEVLCPTGGEHVVLPTGSRHVAGYLKDFLFSSDRLLSPVRVLSGGEKNRLMLALKLSEPCNLLIMDEPTNDLDMETLDLLQEVLSDYEGTLLIISHDRDFLDKTVTSILAFEDNGRITEYAGGYTDYLEKHKSIIDTKPKKNEKNISAPPKQEKAKVKLSYNEQRDLQELPLKMEKLSRAINQLELKISKPDFYEKSPKEFDNCVKELEKLKIDLDNNENRWLELEMLKEQLDGK